MNKTELIHAVAERAAIDKKTANLAVCALFEVMHDTLAHDENIGIVGFGTFEVRRRPERKGRNPQTGENITIPAYKAPVFSASKVLKKAVAGE